MHLPDSDSAKQNRLLAQISEEDFEWLRPHMQPVSLERAALLIEPHQPITHVYFPIDGLASLVAVMEDGATVEAGSVGREGMTGVPVILNATTTPMQTLVQIPGDFIRVSAEVIAAAHAERASVTSVLNRYVHFLFTLASQSAACNRRHDVAARLARWLMTSADGVASTHLAITQEFLAAMLGVRRAGVTETAIRLQDAGLIRYTRGLVDILDVEGLRAAACECYAVLKAEYSRVLGPV